MIVIALGPTRLLDPTRHLVVPPTGPMAPGQATDGMKPVWEHAGKVQDRLRVALGLDACEHDPGVQHRQDGVFRTPMRTETAEERHYRRMRDSGVEEKVSRLVFKFNPAQDVFGDEPMRVLPNGPSTKRVQPPEVDVSAAVQEVCGGPVDLTWFPEGFAFGNGVTTNSWVPLTNPATGERHTVLLSWCVLSTGASARYRADAGVRRAVAQSFGDDA